MKVCRDDPPHMKVKKSLKHTPFPDDLCSWHQWRCRLDPGPLFTTIAILKLLVPICRIVTDLVGDAKPVTTVRLGLIKRRIGAFQGLVGRVVRPRGCNSYADRQGDGLLGTGEGCVPQRIQYLLAHRTRNRGRACWQQDREFFAAESTQTGLRRQNLRGNLDEVSERAVAGVMAVAIVDLLEVIEIEKQQCSIVQNCTVMIEMGGGNLEKCTPRQRPRQKARNRHEDGNKGERP